MKREHNLTMPEIVVRIRMLRRDRETRQVIEGALVFASTLRAATEPHDDDLLSLLLM